MLKIWIIDDAHSLNIHTVDGKYTPLFQDHEYKWFVDLLMEWMSFEEFAAAMRRIAKKSGDVADAKRRGSDYLTEVSDTKHQAERAYDHGCKK